MKQRKNNKYSFVVIRSMSPTTKSMSGVNIDSVSDVLSIITKTPYLVIKKRGASTLP